MRASSPALAACGRRAGRAGGGGEPGKEDVQAVHVRGEHTRVRGARDAEVLQDHREEPLKLPSLLLHLSLALLGDDPCRRGARS